MTNFVMLLICHTDQREMEMSRLHDQRSILQERVIGIVVDRVIYLSIPTIPETKV